jgi:hypothetical protein
MEVRAAETLAPEPGEVMTTEGASGQTRRAAEMSRRVIARPVVLTKEQEYAYIRNDLRRLYLTAGSLFVLMIALLFIIEG